jgi:hypothetical protein
MDLIFKNHIIFVFNLDHMLGLEKKWMLINQMAFSLDVKWNFCVIWVSPHLVKIYIQNSYCFHGY